MLYIGHYQRQVTGDISRALKCYQKAVRLQPDHMEALGCSGDLLFNSGMEEEAFGVYSEVTKRVPVARAKQAWLRVGLYHRKKGQFNDAIHCFQKSLTTDASDKQCWECLAEAYLARGSHTSALRTFARVVELDPESVYCLYQLGNINQVRGELNEAVARYSAVLDLQPNYLPALKGRGHTHYLLALSSLRQNSDAKAVSHVSLALTDLTRAASIKPNFLCVWKLIGNCCTCLHQVHPDIARPAVPEVLCGEGGSLGTTSEVDKTQLFLIGCRSFARALQLSPECSSLWHDLALTYYHLSQISSTNEKKSEFIGSAFSVINKALSISPRDHTHWNLLGVIAAHPGIGKPAVAQHAFISSVQLENNNGLAWANLGALYLKHGSIQLAHKAFSIAQSLDPGYATAWIGQASIAHSIGDADCMDLYRHTTELEYHSEGSRGYGYWVCHSLASLSPDLLLEPGAQDLNQVARRGLLQARDCLQRLTEREPGDLWALNHLALLLEQEGLLGLADQVLHRAEELLEANPSALTPAQCSAVSINRARVLSALGRHEESLGLWLSVNPSPTDLSSRLHLALALHRAGKYKESLQVYEAGVEEADENRKSAVLGACAMVAYALGDTHNCKTYLFKAFETSPPCLHVLIGLCVVGCLTLDLTLLQTALLETSKTIEWNSGDGQMLHASCLVALKIIMNSSQIGSECVETAATLLNQLHDRPQYVESPPLPLVVPLLAASSPTPEALSVHAQKLFHSYPSSVWSIATLAHAAVHLHNSTKTGLKALLNYYVESDLSYTAKAYGKHVEKLKLWQNS
jgi:superkiller protein 3